MRSFCVPQAPHIRVHTFPAPTQVPASPVARGFAAEVAGVCVGSCLTIATFFFFSMVVVVGGRSQVKCDKILKYLKNDSTISLVRLLYHLFHIVSVTDGMSWGGDLPITS